MTNETETRDNFLGREILSPLEQAVMDWLEGYEDEDDRKVAYSDLRQHGCVSGMVSGMVWYTDTVAFFEKHKEDINAILSYSLEECGMKSPGDLFGNNWDVEDPLCIETLNQNLLAWFGFEETAYQLFDEYFEES